MLTVQVLDNNTVKESECITMPYVPRIDEYLSINKTLYKVKEVCYYAGEQITKVFVSAPGVFPI